jgi:hypothetical protein
MHRLTRLGPRFAGGGRWPRPTIAAFIAAFVACIDVPCFAEADPAADGLASARALFATALSDEDAGRYDVALEEFLRVRLAKDTAPVEYRIATCYEGLGRPAPAFRAYRAAIRLGQGEAAMADVVVAARERLKVLSRHVAWLMLVLPDAASPETSVRIDDAAVASDALKGPIALEPGSHTVVATSPGAAPFRSQIALPEGGEATVAVALERASSPVQVSSASREGDARRTAAWITVAAGGVLIVASAATWLARSEDIASLDRSCPAGDCPRSDMAALESTRNRALVEGPLATALGAGGIVAAAVGSILILTPAGPRAPGVGHAGLTPAVGKDGACALWSGVF